MALRLNANIVGYNSDGTPQYGTPVDPFYAGLPKGYTGQVYAGRQYGMPDNDWYGLNPATGKLERLFNVNLPDNTVGYDEGGTPISGYSSLGPNMSGQIGQNNGIRYYFQSDPEMQAYLKKFPTLQSGIYAPATRTGSSTFFDNYVLPGAVMALTGGAIGGLTAGAGASAGAGTAATGTDASTGLYAGESANAGAGTYGLTGGGATGYGTAAAGGTSAGATGAAASGGGEGMWDWLDTIDSGGNLGGTDLLGPQTYNPSSLGDITLASDSTAEFPWLSNAPAGSVLSAEGAAPAVGAYDLSSISSAPGLWDTLSQYGPKALSLLRNLIPSGSGGSPSIPGPFGNSIGNAAFDATPFLLSLYEANKQSGDLNDVIGQINSDAYRKAVLDPYDLQTAYQRGALQQDLGLRGVAGSSFGNQALNNFDYTHGLERSDMASKAALASAGLQGQLINARNTNRNMLLGAGLNASARLFSPQTDPFGLQRLIQQAGG